MILSSSEIKKNQLLGVRYLTLGIKSYSIFLRQNVDLQINDIEKLNSTITCDTLEKQTQSIDRINGAFSDNDKLKPLRTLV
jgi:hypothetical protein